MGATPAFAESPWFHLSSGARPTYLSPEAKVVAVDEVQEITATPGAEVAGKKGALFILSVNKKEVGTFATEELTEFAPEPTPENVQAALEKAYGVGGVLVSGGPLTAKPLVVKTLDPIAVSAIETEAPVGGEAHATVLTKGVYEGPQVIATAVNVGDASTSESSPVKLVDEVPAGLKAVSAALVVDDSKGDTTLAGPCSLPSAAGRMRLEGHLAPFAQVEVRVGVIVEAGDAECALGEPETCKDNEVSVSGGGAPPASNRHPIAISGSPPPFGVQDYELTPEEEGGTPDTQAGSHPFQLTTTFALNQTAGGVNPGIGKYEVSPVGLVKDLQFRLPPGMIGNPHPFAQCTLAQFSARPATCPADTVMGASVVTVNEPGVLGLFTRERAAVQPRTADGRTRAVRFPPDRGNARVPRHVGAYGRRLWRDGQRSEHHPGGRRSSPARHVLGRSRGSRARRRAR